jgi:hypothetical protein
VGLSSSRVRGCCFEAEAAAAPWHRTRSPPGNSASGTCPRRSSHGRPAPMSVNLSARARPLPTTDVDARPPKFSSHRLVARTEFPLQVLESGARPRRTGDADSARGPRSPVPSPVRRAPPGSAPLARHRVDGPVATSWAARACAAVLRTRLPGLRLKDAGPGESDPRAASLPGSSDQTHPPPHLRRARPAERGRAKRLARPRARPAGGIPAPSVRARVGVRRELPPPRPQ